MAEKKTSWAEQYRAPSANKETSSWAEQYRMIQPTEEEKYDERGVPTGAEPYTPAQRAISIARNKDTARKNEATLGITDNPSLPELAGGGIYNGIKQMGVTAAAVGDAIMSPIREGLGFGKNQGAQAVDTLLPSYTTSGESMMEDMVVTGSEFLPGMVVGGGMVAKTLPEATTLLGKVLHYAMIGTGSNAGGALLSGDPDQEKLLMGEDSVTGLLPSFNPKNGDFNSELWGKKMDLLGDSLITGGAAGAVTLPLAAGGRFASNIARSILADWRGVPAQEKKLVTDLLHVFADIKAGDGPKVIKEKMNQAKRLIESNKDVFIKFSEIDPNVDDIQYQNDTVTALIERLNPETQGEQIAALQGLRSSSMSSKTSQLESSLDRPIKAMEKGLDDIQSSRGGSENIPVARDTAIENVAQKEITPIKADLERTNEQLLRATQKTEQLLAKDPTFGPLIEKLGSDVNIDFSGATVDKANQITGSLKQIWSDMTTKKNDLYKAIGNSPIDRESLDNFLGIYGENIPDDILTKLKADELDFQTLHQELGPRIGAIIGSLRNDPAKNFGTIDALSKLQKHIDEDQLDWIAEYGGEGVADRAKAAKEYFVKEYKPYWRDGRLEDIANDFQDFNRPLASQASARKTVTSTLTDPDAPDLSGQMVDVITKNQGKEGSKSVNEFALLNIAQDIQKFVNAKGQLEPADAERFANTLDRVVPILNKTNPEQVPQLNKMLTDLRNNRFDAEELSKTIGVLETNLKDKEAEIYDGVFKDFFAGSGKDRKLYPDSFESMQKLFTQGQNQERVATITEAVKDNPLAKKGLEAAYIKTLQSRFSGSNKTPSGAKQVNVTNVEEFLNEDSAITQYGRTIFGDGYIDLVQELSKKAYNIAAPSGSRKGVGVDVQQFGTEASKNVNTIITWIFGVLNPTAAKLRTVTGQLAKEYDPQDQAREILDNVLANPDEFVRVANEVLRDKATVLSDEQQRVLRKALVKGVQYGTSRDDVDQQTEEVFGK